MVGTIFPLILPPKILNLMYKLYVLQHIILSLIFFEFGFFFTKSSGNLLVFIIHNCYSRRQEIGITQQNKHTNKKIIFGRSRYVISIAQLQGKNEK